MVGLVAYLVCCFVFTDSLYSRIKLTRSADKLLPHSHENIIVQEYIEKVSFLSYEKLSIFCRLIKIPKKD